MYKRGEKRDTITKSEKGGEFFGLENQFIRTQILLGQEAMEKLGRSKVAVFGVGGVGGYVAEALARCGVGAFELIDRDQVSVSNLNRQIIATWSTVGMDKTEAMARRIHDINPGAQVAQRKCFYLPETADQFDFTQYDYVVDAVDTVTAKIEIIMQAQRAGVPVISSMGAGNKMDPSKFEVADIYKTSVDPLARVMRRELKKRGVKDNGDGTYLYKGYTYDGTVYTVDVQVTDNGDGTITAETAKAADASGTPEGGETPASASYKFTNAYDADGTLKLDAEKVFKNGTLHGGEFTFKLMDADGEELQSKTNDAAGNVSFNLITYSMKDLKNSPFTYTVMEVPGTRTDVKYDATVYTVTVELKDNGDGTLEVTKTVDNGGELKFVNEQLNVETTVTIGGEKVLKGRKLKEGEFKFVLADENGKWVDTATNDASGNFTFMPITYKLFDLKGEKSKVYTYGISEVK